MKRMFAVLFAFTLILSLVVGCGEKEGASVPQQDTWPADIAKGLAYQLVWRDANTREEFPVEYDEGCAPDDGRLNDEQFRSKEEVELEEGSEKVVVLKGKETREHAVTFEIGDQYDIFAVVIHNTKYTSTNALSVSAIQVGEAVDALQNVEFEDDNEHIYVDDLFHSVNAFEPINTKVIRIVFDSDGYSRSTLEEISVLGYPKGEKAKWLPEGWTPDDGLPEQTIIYGEVSSRDVSSREKPSQPTDSTPTGELTQTEKALVGSWEGFDPEYPDSVVKVTFQKDRTGLYVQEGAKLPMTWWATEDTVNMHISFIVTKTHTTPYSFENGNLFMKDTEGNLTEFHKVK